MKVVLPDRTGARASGRRHRPRRRAGDRPEAGRAGRARALERPRARPEAAARGRRGDPDPDHAGHVRPGRAVRAPPLLGAPAGRGGAPALPGREGRDRPADRERLLLRLRVPGADLGGRPRAHRRGDPQGARPRAAAGRARRSPATRRARRFEAEQEPFKVELVDTAEGDISLYTQGRGGDFTDLCRGPHLQDSKPIKALKLTGLAGAYWRGDSTKPQLTRIYGTAFYSQADLDAYLQRLEEARKRDHRRLGTQLDLFHLDEGSPGSPFWHPKGMVIWNELEDLRRRENAPPRLRRGEDAADLRQVGLGNLRALGEVPRAHVPDTRRASARSG